MIQEEIDQVKQGKEGYIGIKINSLTDKVIINKLVEASQAGVKIEMVVRGICCLIPEIKGIYREYQGCKYCRPLSGAFQNLTVSVQKKEKKYILHLLTL